MTLLSRSSHQQRPRNLEEIFAADASASGLHLLADVKAEVLKHIKSLQVDDYVQQVQDFVARHQHLPEAPSDYKDFADREAAAAWQGLQQNYPQVAQALRAQVPVQTPQKQCAPQEETENSTAATTALTSSTAAAVSATTVTANASSATKVTAPTKAAPAPAPASVAVPVAPARGAKSAAAPTTNNSSAVTTTTNSGTTSTTTTPITPATTSTPIKPKVYTSIDDILSEGDALGLFSDINAAVQIQPQTQFTLQPESSNAYKPRHRAPDTAVAGICPDYATYEPLMTRCVELLRSRDLVTAPVRQYKDQALEVGQFYLQHGLIALIARSDVHYPERIRKAHNKPSYRVRVIYNNSTQYTPWNYSFLESLIKDQDGAAFYATTSTGERFLHECAQQLSAAQAQEEQQRKEQEARDKGQAQGYLYILQSLSTHPVLTQFMQHSELVKIGFCTTTVAERIKNADHSATYLYAPVRVVRSYPCTNFDPHKFERLVHALLYEHRLNVTLTDKTTGKQYNPQEWFTVSAKTACEIVEHILDGTIMQYRVDSIQGKLVKISS